MALDPEIMKQLIATFQIELEERLETITDGLLLLEKKENKDHDSDNFLTIIEEIFRAAHNIKGAARGIGVTAIGDIVHQIESIFSSIKEQHLKISSDLINVCLRSVDAMRSAIESFAKNTPLSFDLDALLSELQRYNTIRQSSPSLMKDRRKQQNSLVPPTAVSKKIPSNKNSLGSTEHESIRVPVSQIEKVSTLIEQMQINKIALEESYKALVALSKTGDNQAQIIYSLRNLCKIMRPNLDEISTINTSLQEEMGRLRLIPASTLLRHLERYVRDLAQELDKQVVLELRGADVRLDKIILDGLKDPIIHILRNAIDHGIESPEVRKAKGKPECGKISIHIVDEGKKIVITISDDGAGMDYQQIATQALKRKIFSEAELQAMPKESILDLIFRPEFSTKEIITTLSGRGVGLDVVKSNVIDLKGSVTFETEVNQGSSFHLHLPLTLSTDIGLTIKSGGQLFVLPVSSVEHVMMIGWDDIHEVEGNQIILFEEKPIPLRILSDVLSLEKKEQNLKNWLPIVIMKKAWSTIALLVEDIIGECEIVIKPLQAPLNNVSSVSGGTLFGAGNIIIVLNPEDIVKQALGNTKNRLNLQNGNLEGGNPKHILLVDDSITTRTLEKSILENNGYQVTAAVDGLEAWDLLQQKDFSLIITDIEMPKMDGFELTKRIKQSNQYQDIPVIIVTSLGSEEQKKHGIDVGADAYIVKHDFESTELLAIVGQLV